jgi:hypothetical protein
MIIGICGLLGSGKDTLAQILIDKYNFEKLSFASKLKDIVSILFSWNRKLLEGDTLESRKWREEKDEWWSTKLGKDITPRWVLQNIGTDVFRNHFNDNIWLLVVEKTLMSNLHKNYVITDCRFPNEIQMLKKFGAKIINIRRNTPNWFYQYLNEDILPRGVHPSETSWIKTNFDLIIENNDTLEELENKIIKFIN